MERSAMKHLKNIRQVEILRFAQNDSGVFTKVRCSPIVVVLSGTGSDGAMEVGGIKKMNGTVIAQDEKTAEFSGMPSAAIRTGNVDFILALDEISSALVTLVMGNG
jgi:chemotaxis response regulator CheB